MSTTEGVAIWMDMEEEVRRLDTEVADMKKDKVAGGTWAGT